MIQPVVPASVPRQLFATERYGNMHWSLPAPVGLNVEVRLLFAETYSGITDAGQRVFHVSIEGQAVLNSYDIYADVGRRGTMKSFATVVGGDADIDILFASVIENPLVNGIEVVTNCGLANLQWTNTTFTGQATRFAAEWDATPSATNIDGLVGLSATPGSTFSDYAILVRFNNSGTIDARDGDTYRPSGTFPYVAGGTYHFRIEVRVSEHRYWVYVTPPGQSESYLAECQFRTEQNQVSTLANWGMYCAGGSLQVCNFTVCPYVHNLTRDAWSANIQAAIDWANDGDELVLGPGRYTGTGNRDVLSRGKSFTLRGSDPNSRSVVENTIIDCQGLLSERHRAFTIISYQPSMVSLVGISIVNGFAPVTEFVEGYPASAGGAIFCGGSSLNITKCLIRGNQARADNPQPSQQQDAYGGGLFFSGGRLNITDSEICDNKLGPESYGSYEAKGAGVCAQASELIEIASSVISGNAIGSQYILQPIGVGLYCEGPTRITNCRIAENKSGGSEYPTLGGGIYCDGDLYMADCLIENNLAEGGHDMGGFGGGVYCRSAAVIRRCTITGNGCGEGGGIYCFPGQNTSIIECTITRNRDCGDDGRYFGGGGAYGAQLVSGCLVLGNESAFHGGGLYKCKNVIGCTIVGNRVRYEYSGYGGGLGACESISNCIIWGNASACFDPQISSSGVPECSCIQDWTEAGQGVVSGDPGFVDIDSGDWTASGSFDRYGFRSSLTDQTKNWVEHSLAGKMVKPDSSQSAGFYILDNTGTTLTVAGDASSAGVGVHYEICDVYLRPDSRCVNGADPMLDYSGQTDLQGNPRVQSCLPDMGAYESPHSRWAKADFDQDCYVGLADLNHLISCAMGPAVAQSDPACGNANLDLDPIGAVDQIDFAILQRCWTGGLHPASPSCAD